MRVLFATAELAPVAAVGGLAQAAAGLVRALRDDGVEVDLVLPDYGDVELTGQSELELEVPQWVGEARIRSGRHPEAGDLMLVQVPGMDRPHPYVDDAGEGWPDNDQRFMAFSAAIASLSARRPVDVAHLNDWHTAAATGLMVRPVPTVLTIHTLGYQGVMDRSWLDRLPVDAHRFAWYDSANPLAGAIELADRVIAVSPNYAREILTPEAGMGLHERLAARGQDLVGIRNGIDVSVWDPATDSRLAAPFSAADLAGRSVCRRALADEAGWSDDGGPVIAVIGRLVEQKGIDLVLDAVRFLPRLPARLAVLGAGSAELSSGLATAAREHPETVWFAEGYDDALAHRLFGGADLLTMPSRFEPCGLAQMQAMAYGAIPVVTDVGGLHDTVIDADTHRKTGTGFVSDSVDSAGLVDALHRAARAWRHAGRRNGIQSRGMAQDWSWTTPAARHVEIYEELASTASGTG